MAQTKNLWKDAYANLPREKDRHSLDAHAIVDLDQILDDVKRKMEVCRAKQWTIKNRQGHKVILRDVFAKIATWIDKFKQVGDVAIQYDPGHAALPWAAIRFVLQVSVNDVQQYGAVLETIEQVSNVIGLCYVYEKSYLSRSLRSIPKLEESLKALYMAILTVLAKARRFYDKSTFKRMVKNATQVEDKFLAHRENIKRKLEEVKEVAQLSDAENIKEAGEGVERLAQIFADLQNPIDRMETKLHYLQDGLDRERRLKILSGISSIPYKNHHNEACHNRMKGTGLWFLNDDKLSEWIRCSSSSILWLHGGPGTGKTKLVSMLIDQLQANFESGKDSNPVYFYCARNPQEPERANPCKIFQSLLRQMSCLRPGYPILDAVNAAYRRREDEGFASGEFSLTESRDLIIELNRQRLSTTIVLDALDECDRDHLPELLKALQYILQSSSSLVKIFVSSRDDQDIVWRLKDCLNLEIHASKNHHDIVNFVQAEVEHRTAEGDLLNGNVIPALKALIIDSLINKAQGMFRWVVLSLDYLCGLDNPRLVEKRLGILPPKLSDLYEKMHRDRMDHLGEEERKISQNAMRWLLCGEKPLETKDFLYLVTFDVDKHMVPSKENLLKWCSNLVVLDKIEDIFRFAHLSVREYLESKQDYASPLNHAIAAQTCLSILTTDSNILDEGIDAASTSSSEEYFSSSKKISSHRKILTINPLLYACLYWALHSAASQDERQKDPLKTIFLDFTMSRGLQPNAFQGWIRFMKKVVDAGHNIEDWITQMISSPATPLFATCVWGFSDVLKELMDRVSTEQYVRNIHGTTPLTVAALHGHHSICRVMLTEGCFYGCEDALIAASQEGHENIVKMLIEKEVSVNTPGKFYEQPALVAASRNSHEKIVHLLVENGANVNVSDKIGRTPLYFACGANNEKIVKLFIEKGADVNAHGGETALIVAIHFGYANIVKLLIKNGADVNAQRDQVEYTREKMIEAIYTNSTGMYWDGTALMRASWKGHKEIVELLLENGADVNAKARYYQTALIQASANGHEKIIELLLENGADVNAHAHAPYYETALTEASAYGHEKIVELLLEKGADVNAQGRWQQTALTKACQRGHEKIVGLLLENGADVNARSSRGENALTEASEEGHKKIVRLLLENGADVNAHEQFYGTSLMQASEKGHEGIVRLLLENGADVNAQEQSYGTPLMRASEEGHEKIVGLLLGNGADVNARPRRGENALTKASKEGHKKIVRLLLENGADVNARSRRGENALTMATANGHEKIVRLLLENGADVNAHRHFYGTSLMQASKKGHEGIVRLLLENGADVNAQEQIYGTPLMRASEEGHEKIVELLLENGADVNARSRMGENALLLASRCGFGKIVELLLEHGADVNTSHSRSDENALKAAADNGHRAIVEMLLASGADVSASGSIGGENALTKSSRNG